MKHLFVILLMIFVLPSFANIDASNDSPTCDESVLNASNGTANLEINWEPNVIPLRWYSGNTLLEPENNDGTCTYDGVLNRPTNPTREGYNFAGWRVRPTIHFNRISLGLTSSIAKYGKGIYNNEDFCNYYHNTTKGGGPEYCATNSNYMELQRNEWKIIFASGKMLYGMSGCSAEGEGLSRGTRGKPTIENGVGRYCWCKATGYKESENGILYGPNTELYWMFLIKTSNPAYCVQQCATYCAYYSGGDAGTMDHLFIPPDN